MRNNDFIIILPSDKDSRCTVVLDTVDYKQKIPGCVDAELVVEVEHVGALGLVVDLAPPLGLVLTDHLAHVLGDELVLAGLLAEVAAPAGDVAAGLSLCIW